MENRESLKKLGVVVGVVVLGSTGSIGTQTLQILKKHKDKFAVIGLACYSNKRLLSKQAKEFNIPKSNVVLASENPQKITSLIKNKNAKIIVNAITGSAGLKPSIEALKAGKILALANKESVVLEGAKLVRLAKKHKATILPLDSEHHAIARLLKTQNLKKYDSRKIVRIILTCSGGPFYGFTRARLGKVTPKDALKNPNWRMGPKILIESATLLNKGFELIEAHHLFACPLNKLDAIIDRKSVVHAVVEFRASKSGSARTPAQTIALAYKPDMRTVIEDTLLAHHSGAKPFHNPKLKFLTSKRLAKYPFKKIDYKTFPAISRVLAAYKKGQIKTFYKQSERNIEAFLGGKISFTDIVPK